jgi:4-carboxymuconolactone decarboxylase
MAVAANTESERFKRGRQINAQVYGDRAPVPEDAWTQPFWKLILENLFCDVWGREAMSIRDRRLIVIGIIAATADVSIMELQLNSALDNGELELQQIREIPLILHHYIGVPRAAPVMRLVERLIVERGGL